jgi:hypothetical protein
MFSCDLLSMHLLASKRKEGEREGGREGGREGEKKEARKEQGSKESEGGGWGQG